MDRQNDKIMDPTRQLINKLENMLCCTEITKWINEAESCLLQEICNHFQPVL